MIRLPSADDPAVSLIVLLDGTAEMAENCLRAIAAGDDGIPCETIVLLNDPDPTLEDLVRRGTTGGRVIVSRANAGPGVGWNIGASVARAPRLATLHEDSEPDAGWLAPLCETMTETGAGAVGSRLYNHDGSVQNCGWVLFSDASHQTIREAVAPEVVASTDPSPADMLSGAAMLLDRDAVRAAGGWDERFHPAVFVDIDISTAMWNQGRQVLSVPASTVRHLSGTFDSRPNTPLTGPRLRSFLFERHRHRFLAKWGTAVRNLAPPSSDAEGESIKAAVQAAIPLTRERAEQVRSGSWESSGRAPGAERPFTGALPPVIEQGDSTYTVAPAVEEALNVSEREVVDDYCNWLADREETLTKELADTRLGLRNHQQALVDLQSQNQELAVTLDRILNGNTWRLRTLVGRVLQRVRHPIG